jgi:predicted RNA methylase
MAWSGAILRSSCGSGGKVAENYDDFSNDELIDRLAGKAPPSGASASIAGRCGATAVPLAPRSEGKQDCCVEPAQRIDARSLCSRRSRPPGQESLSDALETDLGGLRGAPAPGHAAPDWAAVQTPAESQKISSLEQLFSLASALTRGGKDPSPAEAERCRRAREEISAVGDPLGERYTRLRSAASRRDAGITLTPFRIVDAMVRWAAREGSEPARVVDPGAGTGRFAIAAARAFPAAEIIAVENDPDLVLLLTANLRAQGLSERVRVLTSDFRAIDLPPANGPTLFIGNPPYVRHHKISREWKEWYAAACARHGIVASRLAGMHLHFFAKVAEIGRNGDYGCFITAAEWLDVSYGSALRALLAGSLGGSELHVLEPTAEAFPGTMTTAAITAFRVGRRPDRLAIGRAVDLARLDGGTSVLWATAERTPRWSVLVRGSHPPPPGSVELGELCRVHRGQVTGANHIWVADARARGLPSCVLKPTVTSALEIIAAGPTLDDDTRLSRVIDLPADLDSLSPLARVMVDQFIAWAKSAGAADGYIARHRTPWWAVRLAEPAPIISTYMARRAPVFARNRVGARLLNIAHGIYPRERFTEDQLMALVTVLRSTVDRSGGRTYAGGLTKFEPRELERLPILWP